MLISLQELILLIKYTNNKQIKKYIFYVKILSMHEIQLFLVNAMKSYLQYIVNIPFDYCSKQIARILISVYVGFQFSNIKLIYNIGSFFSIIYC